MDNNICFTGEVVAATVDQDGWVLVGDVKLGRIVRTLDGKLAIQIVDKDKRRAAERGTRFVVFDVQSLINISRAPKEQVNAYAPNYTCPE